MGFYLFVLFVLLILCVKIELTPPPEELVPIGTIGWIVNKQIFASQVQGNYKDALNSCSKHHTKLLDLNMNRYDGDRLFKMIKSFQAEQCGFINFI